jgi:hypothetical protein
LADKTVALTGVSGVGAIGSFNSQVRTSLTMQFMMAAVLQVREAVSIEAMDPTDVTEQHQVAHRGYAVGSIMQATAVLECEIWEVMVYGPGHHLGSNGTDVAAREFLAPMADLIDREGPLTRYRRVLHLLKKEPLDTGGAIWENAKLVVQLRNELMHYKSKWSSELERTKFLNRLQDMKHPKPPFVPSLGSFFPYECLSAACASWAVQSCIGFLRAFYENLGFPDRVAAYEERLRP